MKFNFSKEFGEIDDRLIKEAEGEWNKKIFGRFRLYQRTAAVAAAALLVCAVLGCNSGVQAAVKKFTTKIGEVMGFTKDLSSYTEVIDQTQTQNGISLTLKEVIVDDRVLMVSVHADFGREEGTDLLDTGALWINEEKTRINGQRHMTYESIKSDGTDVDDAVLVQVYEDQILPEGEVNVHLVLEAGAFPEEVMKPNISYEGKAEFVYDFVLTPEELKAKTVQQDVDAAIGSEQKNLILKDLTMNDLYCRIVAEGVTWDDDWPNQYELKLKGTDSFGNPVSLEGGRFLNETEMLFATDFLGDYEAGQVIDEDAFYLSVPDKECEYLDLQLYEREIIWDEVEDVLDEGEEDILDEGEEDVLDEGEEDVLDEDEEVYEQVSGDGEEVYTEENNYGWEPVGEPFRIIIMHN